MPYRAGQRAQHLLSLVEQQTSSNSKAYTTVAKQLGLSVDAVRKACLAVRKAGGLEEVEKSQPRMSKRLPPALSTIGPAPRGHKRLSPSPDDQIAFLRAHISQLERNYQGAREALGQELEIGARIAQAITALKPFPSYNPKRLLKRPSKPVVPVIMLSDWHIGEVISADETEGFGAYNYEIAEKRFFGVVDAFLAWVNGQRLVYQIDQVVVFCLGDYISGDIHHELSVTNEFPAPVQAAKAGHLLAEGLRRLSAHFNQVVAHLVGADNHGRLVAKPQFKQKYTNSFSYLVHAIAAAALAKCPSIRLIEAHGIKHLAEVNGFRFLLEHGDTVRAWMGFPYYGVGRERGREAIRRMNTERGFHYQAIAHWHVPALVEGTTIVNGSLSGTSEFDHAQGRHSLPSQVAFFIHPEHGIFNLTGFRGY